MSNPNAVSIFNGRLTADPKFFMNQEGVEFCASFTVAVQRDRPNRNGEFHSDFYPCRYLGAKRLEVKRLENGVEYIPKIRRIKKGDIVSIVAAFRSESYEKEGELQYYQYFDVERIGTPTGIYPKKDTSQNDVNQSNTSPTHSTPAAQSVQSSAVDSDFPDFDMDLDDDFDGIPFD